MKITIFIALFIAQANCRSLYDMFAPVEDSLGRLVSDVVSDLKDTIDCTILAVKHVFSLGGIFGSDSEYDERCRGQSDDDDVETEETSADESVDDSYDDSYDDEETPYLNPTREPIKEEIAQEINESVSHVSQQIHNILEQSDAHQKIENVKITIKNESDRIAEISYLIKQELENVPDEVRKKFNFNNNARSTMEDLLDEVKQLYKMEQTDKSSAEANEVRRIFDKIFNVLHINVIDGPLSDEDEVILILNHLEHSSNESFIDVKEQVALWSEEQKKQLREIKNLVVNNNNATGRHSDNDFDVKDSLDKNMHIIEKLDEIETQQAIIADFSKSLNDLSGIHMAVGVTDSLGVDTMQAITVALESSGNLSIVTEILSVTTESLIPKVLSSEKYETIYSTSSEKMQEFTELSRTDPMLRQSSTETSNKVSSTNMAQGRDSTEVPSQQNESADISNQLHSKVRTASELSTQTYKSDSFTNVRSIPMIEQNLIVLNQPLTDIQIDNISTELPLSQISSTRTSQSNTQTVFSTTESSELNAQQQLLEEQTPENDTTNESTTPIPEAEAAAEQKPTEDIKSFKSLAQTIFSNESPQDYTDYDYYDYSENTNDDGEYSGKLDRNLIEKLFGSQNKADQQAAVESAKNLIEESQKANAIMNSVFNNADVADAPSIFDDPDYLNY